MQGNLELDIVSGSGVGYGTPDFDAQSERSKYRRDSQSTVAGPPSCASVALRRRLVPPWSRLVVVVEHVVIKEWFISFFSRNGLLSYFEIR